jgi:poly(3-hydroxybutyrate) depolymerase
MRSQRMMLACTVAGAALLAGACTKSEDTHRVFHELDKSTAGASGGSAGASGTAGRAGTAGNTGAGGSATDAGSTTTDGGTSTGCGKVPEIVTDEFVLQHLTTTIDTTTNQQGDRSYWVQLPPDYNPDTPYRVIYLGTGCNGTGKSSYPFDTVDDGQAILVGLNTLQAQGTTKARDCFDDQVANSIEYPFFSALHKRIESDFCVDPQRQFWAGYSSGSWMANMMGCAFSDVLRAVGGVSGGLPELPPCKGPIAQMFIHDMMDPGNIFSGSLNALARVLAINQCTGTDTAPYDVGPNATIPPGSTCVSYTGCPKAYPVVFCATNGQYHESQDPLAIGGLWNFFAKF